MMTLRRAGERGYNHIDWLESYHSFSFGHYYDRNHMGFGPLRVINDDLIAGGGGFAPHGHSDMEILTHVISGELEHSDSLGNGSVIRPGDAQRMSAGSGIRHSEFNPNPDQKLRLLQVWIEPNQKGVEPGYEQRDFTAQRQKGGLTLLASPDGRDGSLKIHQDATMQVLDLVAGQNLEIPLQPKRRYWLQMALGELTLADGQKLVQGDGLALEQEAMLAVTADSKVEALLFDLP